MASFLDYLTNPTAPTGTNANPLNTILTTIGGVVSSIYGKSGSSTVLSQGTSVSTTSGASITSGDSSLSFGSGGVYITKLKQIASSVWFWPVVAVVGVIILFRRKIGRMLR